MLLAVFSVCLFLFLVTTRFGTYTLTDMGKNTLTLSLFDGAFREWWGRLAGADVIAILNPAVYFSKVDPSPLTCDSLSHSSSLRSCSHGILVIFCVRVFGICSHDSAPGTVSCIGYTWRYFYFGV